MSDIKLEGGEKMGYGCNNGMCSPGVSRSFFTKEEKIEMLKMRQKALENEAKGIAERINEIEDEE